jgi:DNA N-6-adenine-methyltransferase Dam
MKVVHIVGRRTMQPTILMRTTMRNISIATWIGTATVARLAAKNASLNVRITECMEYATDMTLLLKKLNTTDEFLTPPEIVKAMGEFDLDPCSSHNQKEPLAAESYMFPEQDGLMLPWHGSVFVNPPFSELDKWITRFVLHGNGILLVPARVEVSWFWTLWDQCEAIFLTKGPVKYICTGDKKAPGFFGGAFCSMGGNTQRLVRLPLKGIFLTEWTIFRSLTKVVQ